MHLTLVPIFANKIELFNMYGVLDRIIRCVKDMGTRFAHTEASAPASKRPQESHVIVPSKIASKSFWTTGLTDFPRDNELPTECEVLVIGAGMSGVRFTNTHFT